MEFNSFRTKRFDDKVLLTLDHGDYLFLKNDEYDNLLNNKITNKKLLEEKGIIINKKKIDKITNKTRQKYNFLFQGASLHIVVPTIRCNHKCIYCHSNVKAENSKGFDMDKETAKKTVDFILQSPSPVIVIEFQGGEPLLRFDLIQYIIDYANKKNNNKQIRFDLVTNLSKMDHDILKYLIKKKVGLCTSLDGPEELRNKNRIYFGGNSYEKTTYWINEIKNHYKYSIEALMVTTKHSLKYPKEIVDEYIKNKLRIIKLRHLDGIGFAEKAMGKIGYKPEEYIRFWKTAMDHIVEKNSKKLGIIRDSMVEIILNKLNGKYVNYTDFQSPCGAAIGQLAYAQDGSIYTCDEGRQFELFKLGNVKKDCYKDILTSDSTCSIIAASVNDSLLCDACAYKPYCGICPVCNYAENGSLVPLLSTDSRCKIYKAMFDYIFSNMLKSKHKKIFDYWQKTARL